MVSSALSEEGSEADGEDGDKRMPTMWRIERTIPLTMEIDKAVFTKITHSTPSEGAGRLDRPIFSVSKLKLRGTWSEILGHINRVFDYDEVMSTKTLQKEPRTVTCKKNPQHGRESVTGGIERIINQIILHLPAEYKGWFLIYIISMASIGIPLGRDTTWLTLWRDWIEAYTEYNPCSRAN